MVLWTRNLILLFIELFLDRSERAMHLWLVEHTQCPLNPNLGYFFFIHFKPGITLPENVTLAHKLGFLSHDPSWLVSDGTSKAVMGECCDHVYDDLDHVCLSHLLREGVRPDVACCRLGDDHVCADSGSIYVDLGRKHHSDSRSSSSNACSLRA